MTINKTPILEALSIMFISFSMFYKFEIIEIEHAIIKVATIPTIE
jgi:hypothetical protein